MIPPLIDGVLGNRVGIDFTVQTLRFQCSQLNVHTANCVNNLFKRIEIDSYIPVYIQIKTLLHGFERQYRTTICESMGQPVILLPFNGNSNASLQTGQAHFMRFTVEGKNHHTVRTGVFTVLIRTLVGAQ